MGPCSDRPGPGEWREPIPERFYFAGDHLSADANLNGTVAFLFACYGAGTPELDEFSKQARRSRGAIAPHPFIAGLPTAMLSRPRGGALAVIGHVERAWGHSFLWAGSGEKGRVGRQVTVFESALKSLMSGMPVGAAMEYFDERYAELASDLSVMLEEIEHGASAASPELASLWTANNDARGYAILGDPAVCVSAREGAPVGRVAASAARPPEVVTAARTAASCTSTRSRGVPGATQQIVSPVQPIRVWHSTRSPAAVSTIARWVGSRHTPATNSANSRRRSPNSPLPAEKCSAVSSSAARALAIRSDSDATSGSTGAANDSPPAT